MTSLLMSLSLLLAVLAGPSVQHLRSRVAVTPQPSVVSAEKALRRTSLGPGWLLYRPKSFVARADGAFDLVIHFHGVPDVVEREADAARLDAFVVTVNLGVGSAAYREALSDPTALDRALALILASAKALVGEKAHLGRLALSAWSAGHGALLAILAQQDLRDRIDAVLVADGMHGALVDPRARAIAPCSLDPFIDYARSAAAGDKLMVITHSAIITPAYASTTESAAFLEARLGLPAEVPDASGATHTGRGGLSIVGLPGGDKAAHALHLTQMGKLTLAVLAARWSA